MKPRTAPGFTLIELSIVLVIIGLLVGGVLGGQELVNQANLRSLASDYHKFEIAARTFRGKYGYWPGDLPTATSYWPANPSCPTGGATGTCNGNGDGMINIGGATGGERNSFGQQLALAGIISGSFNSAWPTSGAIASGIYLPALRYGNDVGITAVYATPYPSAFYDNFGNHNYWRISTYNATVFYTGLSAAFFTCPDLASLDQKIDDGLPGVGKMVISRTGCTTSSLGSDYGIAKYNNSSTGSGFTNIQID